MTDTATWNERSTGTTVGDFRGTSTIYSQARESFGWLPFRLPQIALALLATAPIVFYDPMAELRRSGAATHWVEGRFRRRRFITITQARDIALQILADADRMRAAERLEEARLNATWWNDEDFS